MDAIEIIQKMVLSAGGFLAGIGATVTYARTQGLHIKAPARPWKRRTSAQVR